MNKEVQAIVDEGVLAKLQQLEAARQAFRDLQLVSIDEEWTGLKVACAVLESDYFEEGDEEAPFFTETYLYNLFGKEAARTILAAVRNLGRALGERAH